MIRKIPKLTWNLLSLKNVFKDDTIFLFEDLVGFTRFFAIQIVPVLFAKLQAQISEINIAITIALLNDINK